MQVYIKIYSLSLLFMLLFAQCQNAQDMKTTQEESPYDIVENLDTALAHAEDVRHLVLGAYAPPLGKFPDLGVFKNLEHFSLAQNVGAIDYDFSKNPKLKSIQIVYAKIDNGNITFQNIHQLDSLKELFLTKNNFKELPTILNQESFPNLEWIMIKNNLLESFGGIWLDNCPNIQKLHFSGNKIKVIPDDIDKLKHLRILNLSNNKVETLPITFSKLTVLDDLDLNENQLTSIPNEIFELENLTSLSLTDNKIQKIPSDIQKLTNLQALYLNRNQITELPNELFELENLVYLHVWENQLTEIPEGIQKLKKLEALSIGRNMDISHLPESLITMTNLKELDIRETNIPLEEIEAFQAARPDVSVEY